MRGSGSAIFRQPGVLDALFEFSDPVIYGEYFAAGQGLEGTFPPEPGARPWNGELCYSRCPKKKRRTHALFSLFFLLSHHFSK